MRNKRRKMQEDEIPKSVLRMKHEKEKREQAERNKNANISNRKRKDVKGSKKKGKNKLKRKIILFLILIALITIGVTLGISAYSWKQLAQDMFLNENSIVVDTDGETIATLGVEQKKMKVDFEDIPTNLVNAYVSIEDERFYSHHGVDIRRTGAAILNYVVYFGNSSFGGSTITQQLVKNLTGDSSDSVVRKVKEWWKAFLLECYFSKEDILEMYLNVIYVGPNVYGVQTGAKYYFDKDVSDLSLAECAYLAGINNSPNSYNPFGDDDNDELITSRTTTVLDKMLELGKIDEEEYNEAVKEVNNGLNFEQGEIETGDPIYSYHTDALISEVISDLEEEKNISEAFATNYLYLSGLTIHSTQDSDIQEKVEEEFLKNQYQLKSSDGETTAQAAMVILNHQTGEVLGCTGGLGEKETFRGLNRATQSQRQTGSSIKPLAVLVPGIDKEIFTGATIYDDEEKTFKDGYAPGNNSGYLGEITVRRALESSQNIPFVEMMEEVTPSRAISYLEKMGITSLTKGDESLALALGGLENGITPLEMAGAYGTIANDGEYIEPIFYTTVTDNGGKVVLRSNQETRQVFSEQVAYVVKELLKEPVEGSHGTATYCSISGIDVAAKTGTTDENYDKWICGFTPYYTAVTWFGFDQNESIYYYNQNPAGIIWANVMRSVHNGLNSATFNQPNRISAQYICADTGMVAKTGCTDTYVEYFLWGTVPDECTQHSGSKLTVNREENNNDSSQVYVDKGNDLELNPDDEEKNIIPEENIIKEEPEENTEIDINNNVVEEEPIVNEIFDNEEENQINETVPPETNNTVDEPDNGGETNNVISDSDDTDEIATNELE